jgi:hypothetical protein
MADCSDVVYFPVLIGAWVAIYSVAAAPLVVPRWMKRWREANPRMCVLEPWVTLATLASGILHTVVGGMSQYNACAGDGGSWQGVMYALLIVCEIATVLLWMRPVRGVGEREIVYSIFGYFLVGVVFAATLYLFNDVVEGTITILAVLLRIPQAVLYFHSTPLVVGGE